MLIFQDWAWNTCAWSAEDTRDWVANNLGPTLEAADLRRVKVMILDHNRDLLPWYPAVVSIIRKIYSCFYYPNIIYVVFYYFFSIYKIIKLNFNGVSYFVFFLIQKNWRASEESCRSSIFLIVFFL